ncbi:hypothetical protein AVEN_204861-1 [Araneus ventricosus]|uniref:Uncharacterized protein n=1 Tax=Araneus ventricosus TaxID=182803 RepID=A0A4Y2T883_ARAVE|nr:hypothetical protein AVEN_204861-1 [Araneus ventricosus]
MAVKAWNCVEAKAIANCSKKLGFLKKVEVRNSNDVEKNLNDTHAVDSINKEWRLISNALQVDPLTTFQDSVEIYQNGEMCGDLIDADIVREVRSPSEEEYDSKYEPIPKITLKEALSPMKTMPAFILSMPEMTTDTFRAFSHLENVIDSEKNRNKNQTVLDRYFKQSRVS